MTEHEASTPVISQREVAPLPPQAPGSTPPAPVPVVLVGAQFYAGRDLGLGVFFGFVLALLFVAALVAIAGFALVLLGAIAAGVSG